ncbi:MAG: HAD family hydrolase, partial [Anaerolineales bacterium]
VRPFARRLVMAAETPGNFLYRFADFLGIDAYISWILSRTIQHGRSRRRLDVERHLLVNGVQEMLMDLASKYRLAVVSARDAESTSHFLKHFNLAQYFNVIVTAQSCKHTKPYPEPILLAALQLGLLPKACVMVGDTVMDIHAGKAAGAQTIAVLCGFGTLNELIKAEADMILSTTSQLVDIFI